ncbi:MAG: LuxR C-terminal-related transcriptional regulator [Bacteroidia bacterium]|jgi:DNA-binding NarL/FixJ family response regulator|nr:LuxR C-terminal-related transcriptional regulator [Bacteroidia bacterium]
MQSPTKREMEVLKLISKGYTDHAIAKLLELSVNTVRTHRQNLRAKFNVSNSISMIKIAHDKKMI